MYPLGNLEQKAYGDNMAYSKTLEGGSSMRIEVVKIADWKNYKIEEEEVIKVVTTEGFDNNKFPGAGLPFYEFTFSFMAEVPYENEGWSNGIDLRKVDTIILKKKIRDYFKMYQKTYEEKNSTKIVNINYDLAMRNANSLYKSKEDINDLWGEYNEDINTENKDFQALENYELTFYRGGKIVTFKHSSDFETDEILRGCPALYYLYDENYYANFLGVYLYLPESKYNG